MDFFSPCVGIFFHFQVSVADTQKLRAFPAIHIRGSPAEPKVY